MKRIPFTILMVVAAAFVAFAGGGQEGTDSDQATVSMMGGGHLVSIAEVVLEGFLEDRPDITMEYEKYPFAEYPTKMRLQLSTGETDPDVMIIHDFLAPQFAGTGWLMDLTDRVPVDQLLPNLQAATVDRKIYGVPNQSIVMTYLYRSDVFDRLGLEPPTNAQEYVAVAQTLRENDLYIDAYDPNENAVEVYLIYLHMNGGAIFDFDGDVILDSPEAVDALEQLASVYEAGLYFPSDRWQSDEYWTAMNAGEIVSLFAPNYTAAYFDSNIDPNGSGGAGEWRMTSPPRLSADGPGTYSTNTEYWVINQLSDEPEAAWDVIEYLTLSEEAGQTFADIDREGLMVRMTNNYRPSLQNIAGDSLGWDMFGGQQVLSEVANILLEQSPQIPYKDARTTEAERLLDDALSEYFAGSGETPEEVVFEAAEAIRSIE